MTGQSYSPIPFADVAMTGPFWRERLDTALTRTIPSQHVKLKEAGILDSLKLPKPVPPLTIPCNKHNFTTQIFWDSDVGKWIEAASYALSHRRDADVEAKIDAIVDDLARAQSPDGYLNCWYNGREPDKRWTNLRDNHELYNAGHLLEGAIAYFRATGRRRFLDLMERYMDHVAAIFGRGPGQKRGYDGHQEIELALVKLYRLTGDRRRLDLAAYFIDERGRQPHYFTQEAIARGEDPAAFWAGTYEYNQSHLPVREQTKMVGHAVRAMYMASAMADLALELDDPGLKRACEALWRDVTDGADLRDRRARTEGEQRRLHRALRPAQRNRLRRDLRFRRARLLGAADAASRSRRRLRRRDGARALQRGAERPVARRHAFFLRQSAREPRPASALGVAPLPLLHDERRAAGRLDRRLLRLELGRRRRRSPLRRLFRFADDPGQARHDQRDKRLSVVGRHSHRGRSGVADDLRAEAAHPRLGEECDGVGQRRAGGADAERGYAAISRRWSAGDVVALDLPMPPERLYAHPSVRMDVGRVALRRGPLIYCVEEADNPGGAVQRLTLPRGAPLSAERAAAFGGATTLKAPAKALAPVDGGALYSTAPPISRDATLTAVPYFLWANREPGSMQVWIAEARE